MSDKNSPIVSNIVALFSIVVIAALSFYAGILFAKTKGVSVNTENQVAGAQDKTAKEYLKEMKVDTKKVEKCLADGSSKSKVAADQSQGESLGVQGTPTSFLVNSANNKVIRFPGALPMEAFVQAIDIITGKAETNKSFPFEDVQVPGITDKDHVRGNSSATLILYEYSDFDCPYCAKFHSIVNELLAKRDDLKVVYRHFPLDSLHPDARKKAETSECVAAVGGESKFWEMVDKMFAN